MRHRRTRLNRFELVKGQLRSMGNHLDTLKSHLPPRICPRASQKKVRDLACHLTRSFKDARLMKRRTKALLFASLLLFFMFLQLVPRREFGVSAVYEMTHWICLTSVPHPVTVKMLINAESRPYLSLMDVRYSPTPVDVQEVVVHFRPGDQGQRGLLITWVVDEPQRIIANLTFTVHETRHISPSLSSPRSGDLQEFLEPTALYPTDDPVVQSIASEISHNLLFGSRAEKAQAVYDWIRTNMKFDQSMGDEYHAAEVLKEKRAVCEGFAYAFSTLCRALDVPARVYYGKMIDPSARGIFWRKHCWAEFWDGVNWQPVDPTLGCFGSLTIHPYVHGSFGLWAIDVRSERGAVWPLNEDGKVAVSDCGLDWSKLIGYRYSPYAYIWFVQDLFRIVGVPLIGVGGMMLIMERRRKQPRLPESAKS